MRRPAAVLILCIMAVVAVLPMGCARHTKTETFSGYGFSFEYPAGYEVDERGNTKGEENSYASGLIAVIKEPKSRYLMRWATVRESDGLQDESALRAALGRFMSELEEGFQTTDGSMQFGEIVEDSCLGHKMLRCYYKVMWSGGETVNGEIGVLYCSESQRWFELTTRSVQTEDEDEALAFFHIFSSSLVCH